MNIKHLNMQKVSIISGGNFLRGIHWNSQNWDYRVPKGSKWDFLEKNFQKKFFLQKFSKIFFSFENLLFCEYKARFAKICLKK